MESQFIALLQGLQNVDNAERQAAEQTLSHVLVQDPSTATLTLLSIASNTSFPTADRQSALLCLKRLVPVHWSAGFESFTGPAVSVEAKDKIRPALLALATDDTNSKIRSGAAYAVTQIAAVDYPDEWPSLMESLYNTAISGGAGVLGALALLQELFDDLVTEEQFFLGNVGVVTIRHCMKLMTDTSVQDEVRTAAAKLFKTCLSQLGSPDVLEDEHKSQAIHQHITEVAAVLTVLLQDSSLDTGKMLLRTVIYTISNQLVTEFPEEMIEHNAKVALQKEAVSDFLNASQLFVQLVVNQDEVSNVGTADGVPAKLVASNLIIEQLQLLSSLCELPLTEAKSFTVDSLLNAVLASSLLPLDQESDYSADFNLLVTEETGVSPDYYARNATYDFLTELSPEDANEAFQFFLSRFAATCSSDNKNWKEKEAVMFCLDALFRHDAHFQTSESLVSILNIFISLLQDSEPFIRYRGHLVIPAYLSKFSSNLGGEFSSKSFLECVRQANNDSETLVKAGFLVSLTYFNSTINLNTLPSETHHVILSIIASVLEEAQDDTPPLLAEALAASLKIDTPEPKTSALTLLFQVASKDPGNIQLTLDVEEAFEELFMDIDMNTYIAYADVGFPGLLQSIEESKAEFSSQLSLALQIITTFINSIPEDPLPESLFNRANSVLSKNLLEATDDQILQIGSDAYHALITHTPPEYFDINTVLQILSKLLSPDLSDSAAMNVGSMVVAVLSRFSDQISSIIPQLLEATTSRLLTATRFSTIGDLLSVLCLMVSTDIEQTISFLQQHEIQKVFNVWLHNFPTLSGIDLISKNYKSLMDVFFYSLKHPEQFQFTVDGDEIVDVPDDVIITRSMRKNMEKQYTQVPLALKIVKIFVTELKELSSQPDQNEPEDYANIATVNDDDDGGWEDIDDIHEDFETLSKYVDNGDRPDVDSGDLKEHLIGFFKQAASEHADGFRNIYNALPDEDRQILAENII